MAQSTINGLRICWRAKRGKRLVCKKPITDEEVVKEVLGLINELKERINKHKGKLETAAFIDELISLLEQWLEEHRNDKGKKVRETRKIVRKIIKLLKKLRKKYVEAYWRQLLELMNLLERNATDIIVTGENDNVKSLVVHLYNKDVAVIVSKIAKSGSTTINLTLSELEGDHVDVANTFSDKEVLKAVQRGWELTDGGVTGGHPVMTTTQPWQLILWALCYPGKVHVRIDGISINENGASIKWHLTAMDHKSKPKKEAAEEAKKLNVNELKVFLAPAIWGDGHIFTKERREYIRLIIGLTKYDLWYEVTERLINELGFRRYVRGYKVEVEVRSSKAIKLAKTWLETPNLRELIELGASLPSGGKLRRIIELASKEVKEKGSSSIVIPGTNVSMGIHIGNKNSVVLRTVRKDEKEVLRVYEELKNADYKPTIYVENKNHVIIMAYTKIVKDPRLREPVCRKLSEWLNETKDEKRRKKLTEAIQKLMCSSTDQSTLKAIKEPGSSSTTIPGTNISMTVSISKNGKVELITSRRDKDKALRVYKELKNAGYNPTIRNGSERRIIAITYTEIRSKPELKKPICDYLRERYEELSSNINDKWRYANAMRKLGCPDINQ